MFTCSSAYSHLNEKKIQTHYSNTSITKQQQQSLPQQPKQNQKKINLSLTFTTTLVMLQTPAMGIAQAGMIKRKNALSMLMQTISGMCIGSI